MLAEYCSQKVPTPRMSEDYHAFQEREVWLQIWGY